MRQALGSGLVLLLAYLAYGSLTAWWQHLPPTNRFFWLAGTGFAVMAAVGIALVFLVYRKRARGKMWGLAMAGWRNASQRDDVIRKQSAMHLSDLELEKLAEQVYKKLGYNVQHVGQTGDHGVDVLLVNASHQKEIVQCKQWNKPVGEAALRDLYGAMMHDRAVRGWIWAPRGFSGPARAWAKGKPIILVDDAEINRLIGVAYKNGK